MITENQLLALMMSVIPAPEEGPEINAIRNRFMKRDRAWSEVDVKTEYRYIQANAIIEYINKIRSAAR